MRRTFKRVKEVVDKMNRTNMLILSTTSLTLGQPLSTWTGGSSLGRLPQFHSRWKATVCYSSLRQFPEKLQSTQTDPNVDSPVTHQHTRGTTLDLKGQHVGRLPGVLEQCPTLTHLDQRLCGNFDFGTVGTERPTELLGQCRGLVTVNLNLSDNPFRTGGTKSLAGALGKWGVLDQLNLIGPLGLDDRVVTLLSSVSGVDTLEHVVCDTKLRLRGPCFGSTIWTFSGVTRNLGTRGTVCRKYTGKRYMVMDSVVVLYFKTWMSTCTHRTTVFRIRSSPCWTSDQIRM